MGLELEISLSKIMDALPFTKREKLKEVKKEIVAKKEAAVQKVVETKEAVVEAAVEAKYDILEERDDIILEIINWLESIEESQRPEKKDDLEN